ncbi:uncharacterized protein LOC114280555 [Camellia sinensis]|uniref:uncharacterized protein LOC114280555 n=1 Tax=Camellia sinensis TaxID=4442 RepID=UPI001036C73E|nr:uncharacterized protein LOC114280555 [Camellia sinensis]
MKPPTFLGGIEPLKAETWLLEMKKLFEVFLCSETQKVLLATYTLKDEARIWWLLVRNNDENMTWAQFNTIFHDKYFPQCFRDRKVSEFQELKQDRMSVAEALMAEAILAAKKQTLVPQTDWMGKRSGNSLKRGRSFTGNKKQNTRSSSSSSQSGGSTLNCTQYGRRHRGVCHRVSGACFQCGKTGNIIKDCPIGSESVNRPVASSAGSASGSKANVRTNTGKEPLRQG